MSQIVKQFVSDSNGLAVVARYHVGVYGTLKTGFPNYPKYIEGAEQVGFAYVPGLMLHCAYNPMIVSQPKGKELKPGGMIKVEVFKVSADQLTELDNLEGHPDFFERRQHWVIVENGVTEAVWVYYGNSVYLKGKRRVIWDGIWNGHTTKSFEVDFGIYENDKPRAVIPNEMPYTAQVTSNLESGDNAHKPLIEKPKAEIITVPLGVVSDPRKYPTISML